MTENITTTKIKHRFLCCNGATYEPLIWRQYGYWHCDQKRKILYPMPEWITEETYKSVAHLVENLKEPNLQIKIKTHIDKDGLRLGTWGASWILYDDNNPHIEPNKGGVTGCKTEESARAYAMQRYHELKRLYDGDIEALLVYRKTGVACLPNWNTNDIDSWGYKQLAGGEIIRTRVPRAEEVTSS